MTIAFIRHRYISVTTELQNSLYGLIENFILHENADTFLFGSKSEFDTLCYDTVTELQKIYPYIKRIYVRAEFECISKQYTHYLLSLYEDTFYPPQISNSGNKAYVERNQIMIDMCDKLIVYYDPHYMPSHRNSGTQIAIQYATKKNKSFYNICKKTPLRGTLN